MDIKERQKNIELQFAELSERYGGLTLSANGDCSNTICGKFSFDVSYNGREIKDEFEIQINIPNDYPDSPPIAKEIGNRIPKDFHTNPDESLCLSSPLRVRMRFSKNKTLLGFVDELVIPFLYSYRHLQEYGEMPYGEFSHGGMGILECYREHFGTSSDNVALSFLKILVSGNYRGHHTCPCGSGKKIRQCHGEKLKRLMESQRQEDYFTDLERIIDHFKTSKLEIPKNIVDKAFLNRIKKLRKKATE